MRLLPGLRGSAMSSTNLALAAAHERGERLAAELRITSHDFHYSAKHPAEWKDCYFCQDARAILLETVA